MNSVAQLPLPSLPTMPRRLVMFIVLSMLLHAVFIAAGAFFKGHFEQVDDVISISTNNISVTLIDPIRPTIIEEPVAIEPIKEKIITTENTSAVVMPVQKKVIKEEPKKPVPPVKPKPVQKKRAAASPPPQPVAQPIKPAATPTPIYNPKPPYPLVARRRGTEGTLVLEVTLLNNGTVKRAFILESSGSSLLDRSALDTIKTWRWPANRFNSFATIRQPIKFRLENY